MDENDSRQAGACHGPRPRVGETVDAILLLCSCGQEIALPRCRAINRTDKKQCSRWVVRDGYCTTHSRKGRTTDGADATALMVSPHLVAAHGRRRVRRMTASRSRTITLASQEGAGWPRGRLSDFQRPAATFEPGTQTRTKSALVYDTIQRMGGANLAVAARSRSMVDPKPGSRTHHGSPGWSTRPPTAQSRTSSRFSRSNTARLTGGRR